MEQNIFLQGYFKIILYLYHLKNSLNILVALLKLTHWDLMEHEKKILKNTTKSDSNFAASFVDNHVLWDINFNGRSLINIYIPKKVISIYLLCNKSILKKLRDFALDNRLFGSVKLTKTTDQDKYKYSSYRRGFDSDSKFSFTDGNMVKNVIILGVDRSLSVS